MGTFNAANAVDGLEWDFTLRGQKKGTGPKGTVPEPSEGQVNAFFAALRGIAKEFSGVEVDPDNPGEVSEALESLDEAVLNKAGEALLDAHAEICAGSPSREQMAELPYRVRMAWYGALQGWLTPERGRPATKR